ncbi:MAG TPA: HAD-IA family hydrolase, partial [Thermoanaerobaculia bacterium]|nr:HAD-IA family hydrolase [Thermoanaerobaculia bacterium]
MKAPGAIVFDLDGTLIDSRADLAASINRLRQSHGLSSLSLAEVSERVGRGARVLVERSLPEEMGGPELESSYRWFLADYAEHCTEATQPYPGIVDLLEEVAARYPMALATNKPEAMTRKILAHLDLARFFAVVVAGDTLAVKKPDPAVLHHLEQPLRVRVADFLLVGDSEVDAETAHAASCRLALVSWGFGRA